VLDGSGVMLSLQLDADDDGIRANRLEMQQALACLICAVVGDARRVGESNATIVTSSTEHHVRMDFVVGAEPVCASSGRASEAPPPIIRGRDDRTPTRTPDRRLSLSFPLAPGIRGSRAVSFQQA
jgi:hypothetical protein